MTAFLVVLHILVSLFLILFVLLQPGARGGVGAAFGGAGGQTVFGGRGANTFLAKLTAAAAVIFMLTSITLSYFGTKNGSIFDKKAAAAAEEKKADEAKADDAKPADAPKADDAKVDAAETGPATDGPSTAAPTTAPAPAAGDAAPTK
jgi:preprotein translocase subunit SecG